MRSTDSGSRSSQIEVRVVISVVAALGLQFFSGSALPLLLGSISEQLGFGAEQIGLLSACELAAIAVFAIGLTPVVARRSRVAFAALGTAISVVGHAIGVPAESFTWLVVSRLVAGAGIGMAAAAAQAAIAASSQPDRIFALFFAVSTPLGAIELALMPYALEPAGYAGGYAVLAGISLLALPLVVWLPRAPIEDAGRGSRLRDAPGRALALPAMLAVVLLGASDLGVWAFAERIGSGVGLSIAEMGNVLAIATMASAVSAVFAAWLGTRAGRIVPLTATLLIMLGTAISIGHVTASRPYGVLLAVWGGTIFVAFTYVMGSLAALDPRGRWSAAAAGARTVGGAIGPAATGLAAAGYGFPGLGWLVAAWCGLALALPLAWRLPSELGKPSIGAP